MRKIILASTSPRRKILLRQIGLEFTTVSSDYNERFNLKINPHKLVEQISFGKAKSAAVKHKKSIIIAADTLVVFKNKIIGKPIDDKDAKRILQLLSGKTHLIITGFTIIDTSNNKLVTKSVETKVYMKKITNKEICAYVKTGEPLDKAGAYGIQEKGSIFIEKIEGDYFNVVGLPIYSLVEELKKFGIKII